MGLSLQRRQEDKVDPSHSEVTESLYVATDNKSDLIGSRAEGNPAASRMDSGGSDADESIARPAHLTVRRQAEALLGCGLKGVQALMEHMQSLRLRYDRV